MLNKFLFKQIDNSGLITFRVCFGLLITLETWGAIFTGWVRRVLIEPQFTFNFIGFDFLQPLPGNGMYFYFILMGIFGIFVMIGFKYRFSIIAFTLMWTCVYLMQKTSYNNHYYLLILICIFMCFAPAHRYLSIDVRKNPNLQKISMPQWIWLFIVFQLGIVYTFAAGAKIYPDWMDGTVGKLLLSSKSDFWLIGEVFTQKWAQTFMTYFAILFDLLIVPLMLWKKTRFPMFILAIFFHLFNSIVFQIGIFPYLSLAFFLFFFPTKTVHKRFLSGKKYYSEGEVIIPNYKNLLITFLGIWFVVQIALPLRHWFIKDAVLWTEEGHRLSWRMMLRNKYGRSRIKIINKEKGETKIVRLSDYLTPKQVRAVGDKPDILWQFCQHLKSKYTDKGEEIEIYVDCRVSVNGRLMRTFIDPNVDMAKAEWHYFFHNEWILPSKLDK
ncbi:MAG TPA: HTTM domain-containing protein [Flavobacteriaceae bacterium]|nr:HTTM domain-containing protein [Flavobacteriaceae bacterium]